MRVLTALALLFTSWLLSLNSLKAEVLDVTCYTGRGQNYRGTVATTTSGRRCQSWSVQTPHSHIRTPENRPCSGLENNNYCRNPVGDVKPYCFTTDPQKRFEYCEIPQCVPQPEPIVPELSCFTLCGQNYRGTVATTTSGRRCQSWSVQTPHSPTVTPEKFPHAGLENNNYCRNPNGDVKPWCYTTDPQKRLESCEIPRCVPDKPTPTLVSDRSSVLVSDSVTLTCTVEDSTASWNIYWSRVSEPVKVTHGSTYTFRPIDPGTLIYRCRGGRGDPPYYTQYSSSVSITVSKRPPAVLTVLPNPAFTGETVTFTCDMNEGEKDWSYTIDRDGAASNNYSGQNPYTFTKRPHSTSFSGEYQCTGRLTEDDLIIVKQSDKITWTVSAKPTPKLVSDRSSVLVSGSVTLTCTVEDSTASWTIYWVRESNLVKTGGSTYTFSPSSVSESGQYRCRGGRGDPPYYTHYSNSVYITVSDGPKNVLLAVDPPGDVVKGSSVTLTCSASGSHPPIQIYILYKDNTEVAQKNTMIISDVQPSHSGTYHCEAFNDIATVHSPPVTVAVHYPPEKPSVSVSPPGSVVEGSTVTLTCSSEANPPVDTYTWYKDHRSISTGPQLVKNNVSPGDSGQYFCLVKNTHGYQRSSLHSLDVQRLRKLPTHCGPPEVYSSNRIMITPMTTRSVRYAPGATVFYACMVGYIVNGGHAYVRCVAGKWTPLTLTCEGQCGRLTDPTGNELRISGGTLSRPGDHPWQVSLQHKAKNSTNARFRHACGGVLIASCWVLTAAHCIDSTKDMQVVVGGVDIGSKEESDQVISVKRDFVFLGYRKLGNIGAATNDIALLQLEFTDDPFCAKETSYVKYACLPNQLFPDGKECVVAGWGKTKDADHPHKMSHGQLSMMSDERCQEFHTNLDGTMICAGDKLGKVGSCSGDSGGPLMCKDDGVYYMAGLVSWGSATCGAAVPGVYANVHQYVAWISGCVHHHGKPCKTQSVIVKDDYDYDDNS